MFATNFLKMKNRSLLSKYWQQQHQTPQQPSLQQEQQTSQEHKVPPHQQASLQQKQQTPQEHKGPSHQQASL